MTGAPGPLAGATVVVTRPRGGGDGLAEELRAAGACVVALPVVEIADPGDAGAALAAAVAELSRYEWVAFTSANAVARVLAAVAGADALSGVRLAAIGPATAAALADHELTPDLVAADASAEGLAAEFPPPTSTSRAGGAAVLFPASAGARPALAHALRAKGWEVDQVVAYRTVPAPAPSATMVGEVAAASAVTFASPSAVEAYVSLRGRDGLVLPVPPIVACIGPVTAAAARAAGMEGVFVASSASSRALVAAIADALARSPGAAPR